MYCIICTFITTNADTITYSDIYTMIYTFTEELQPVDQLINVAEPKSLKTGRN